MVREITVEEMKKLVARKGKPLLINFWATWCEPCRAEFPDLVQIDKEYRTRGLEMMTFSLDDIADIKTTVPQFLTEMKAMHIPAYLLSVSDPGKPSPPLIPSGTAHFPPPLFSTLTDKSHTNTPDALSPTPCVKR
ncbi:MAG: TlpA disulfide reductase family protein [Pyrinomonadaceae bacterium]